MGSSVLQDLLKDHNSEIGDWSEIVNNHQEDESAAESLRSRQSIYNINQDGPFYIFVSQLNLIEPNQHSKEHQNFRAIQNDVYNFFEGQKNLFHVHLYPPITRGCCMLRVKNFESCIQILRKDGENYKDKPIRVEYVVPNDDELIKYTRFTSVQLDAQMEMYQQKQKSKPPKPNPFGDAKPADISKKMEEIELKFQAEKNIKPSPIENIINNNKPQENTQQQIHSHHVRTFQRSNTTRSHPNKNESFRDNRSDNRSHRGGGGGMSGTGGDHHHPPQHHQGGYQAGHKMPYNPRILSHRSNDSGDSKGSYLSNTEIKTIEENKNLNKNIIGGDNRGGSGGNFNNKNNKNIVVGSGGSNVLNDNNTITTKTSSTGESLISSTISTITTTGGGGNNNNTIATTSITTNGSTITTSKSNISTTLQQQQQQTSKQQQEKHQRNEYSSSSSQKSEYYYQKQHYSGGHKHYEKSEYSQKHYSKAVFQQQKHREHFFHKSEKHEKSEYSTHKHEEKQLIKEDENKQLEQQQQQGGGEEKHLEQQQQEKQMLEGQKQQQGEEEINVVEGSTISNVDNKNIVVASDATANVVIVSTNNMEKKTKKKDKKNKKTTNKNQGGGSTSNRFSMLKDHPDFDA